MATNRFYPQRALINALTNATQAVTTFTADHDFTLGEVVSFRVTSDFGMFQINQKKGIVLALTSDTITVDIDSSSWDPFDFSLIDTVGTTPPQCVPCCSVRVPGSNPPQVNINDTFDNRRV